MFNEDEADRGFSEGEGTSGAQRDTKRDQGADREGQPAKRDAGQTGQPSKTDVGTTRKESDDRGGNRNK